MGIERVREVFNTKLEPYGEALDVIYAEGGLMAHHDGVNAAVKAFWDVAEPVVLFRGTSAKDMKEIDEMYGRIVNLTMNANTRPEDIVGYSRYSKLVNAL